MDAQPPPSPLPPLSVLQWNINGLRPNSSWLQSTLAMDQVDVALLQETRLPEHYHVNFRHYDQYHHHYEQGTRQGTAILVRKSLAHDHITSPIFCGEGVDVLAVSILLPTTSLTIYNIYRRPHEDAELDLAELFEYASHFPTLIGGDFNAHHPLFLASPTTRSDISGLHLTYLLQEFPEVVLLNNPEPTHIQGNALDLTFASKTLSPGAAWCVHPTLSSDHYAILTVLHVSRVQPLPPPHDLTTRGQTGVPSAGR